MGMDQDDLGEQTTRAEGPKRLVVSSQLLGGKAAATDFISTVSPL